MGIEHYFNFLSDDDIRIAGTRVGIETVLYDYIYRSRTAEQIADTYPSINLEQVYATTLSASLHQSGTGLRDDSLLSAKSRESRSISGGLDMARECDVSKRKIFRP